MGTSWMLTVCHGVGAIWLHPVTSARWWQVRWRDLFPMSLCSALHALSALGAVPSLVPLELLYFTSHYSAVEAVPTLNNNNNTQVDSPVLCDRCCCSYPVHYQLLNRIIKPSSKMSLLLWSISTPVPFFCQLATWSGPLSGLVKLSARLSVSLCCCVWKGKRETQRGWAFPLNVLRLVKSGL